MKTENSRSLETVTVMSSVAALTERALLVVLGMTMWYSDGVHPLRFVVCYHAGDHHCIHRVGGVYDGGSC